MAAHLGYESDVPDDEPLEDLADDDPVESSRKAEYEPISHIIMASILHSKEHTTYCLRLSTATGA